MGLSRLLASLVEFALQVLLGDLHRRTAVGGRDYAILVKSWRD